MAILFSVNTVVKMIEYFQLRVIIVMWFFVWYTSFKEFSPYSLVACLLGLGLVVGFLLFSKGFPFIGFVSYIGVVAGVVVLLAYIVALGGGSFERDRRKFDKEFFIIRENNSHQFEFKKSFLWQFCWWIIVICLLLVGAYSVWEIKVSFSENRKLYSFVWNKIFNCSELMGFSFRDSLFYHNWENLGFKLYSFLRLRPYWGYFCVFLAIHLFLVIVGCISVTDCYKGALVKKQGSCGKGNI